MKLLLTILITIMMSVVFMGCESNPTEPEIDEFTDTLSIHSNSKMIELHLSGTNSYCKVERGLKGNVLCQTVLVPWNENIFVKRGNVLHFTGERGNEDVTMSIRVDGVIWKGKLLSEKNNKYSFKILIQ